jgi:hypothetical protein
MRNPIVDAFILLQFPPEPALAGKGMCPNLVSINDRSLSELPGEMMLGELRRAGPPGSFDRAV